MESKNLMYAYSLGCLVKEDIDKIVSIIDSKEPFEYEELGEFQNLAALLPAILNMESPSIDVKDKVARKLYRLQEELKKKKAAPTSKEFLVKEEKKAESPAPKVIESDEDDITSVFDDFPNHEIKEMTADEITTIEKDFKFIPSPVTNAGVTKEPEPAKTQDDNLNRITVQDSDDSEFEVVSPKEQVQQSANPSLDTQTKERLSQDSNREKTFGNIPQTPIPAYELDKLAEQDTGIKLAQEKYKSKYTVETKKRKSSAGIVLFILFLFVLIAAAGFGYYKYMGIVDGYESKIKELNNQVGSLQTQLTNEETMNQIMDSRGLFVAELSSADFNSKADAKLFLSGEKGEALFRLSGLPLLPGESVYQIWINSGSKFEPIVSFNAEEGAFTLTATVSGDWVKPGAEVRITEEINTEAERPGSKIILQGTVR